jgi:GT2 family glycosyltransferase
MARIFYWVFMAKDIMMADVIRRLGRYMMGIGLPCCVGCADCFSNLLAFLGNGGIMFSFISKMLHNVLSNHFILFFTNVLRPSI